MTITTAQAGQQEPSDNPNPHLAWVVEYGAIDLPLGHPSRLTVLSIHDREEDAAHDLYEARKDFNARMWPISLNVDGRPGLTDEIASRAAVSSLSAGGATPSQAAQEGATPLQGLAAYLRAQASNLDVHAPSAQAQASIECLRRWASEVESAPPPAAAAVEAVPGWDAWAAFSRAQDLIEAIAHGACDEPRTAAHSAAAELAEVRRSLAAPPAAPVEAQPTYAHALLSALSKVRAVVPVAPDLEAEQRVSTLEFQFASWGEQTEAHVAWLNFRAALSEAQPVARVGSPSMGEGNG